MAPQKKSAKAIAAELKKKNSDAAKDIVSNLQLLSQKQTSGGNLGPHIDVQMNSASSTKSASSDRIKSPLKKLTRKDSAELKKKNNAKDVVKLKELSEQKMSSEKVATTSDTMKPAANSLSSATASCVEISAETSKENDQEKPASEPKRKRSNENNLMATKSKRSTQHPSSDPKTKPISSASKVHGAASTLKSNRVRSEGNTGTSAAARYEYEIDCKKVAGHVNVNDFQKYLQKELKVGGSKNNLGETVTICCHNEKVEIKSKVYLPKRSLRFYCKKFLKKKWNIQVVSKNARAYEFKFVGTL